MFKKKKFQHTNLGRHKHSVYTISPGALAVNPADKVPFHKQFHPESGSRQSPISERTGVKVCTYTCIYRIYDIHIRHTYIFSSFLSESITMRWFAVFIKFGVNRRGAGRYISPVLQLDGPSFQNRWALLTPTNSQPFCIGQVPGPLGDAQPHSHLLSVA